MIKCSGRTTIRRAVLLSCIILSSSITFVVRHHIVFERYLNSITISFSDFPSDYTQALHSAREAKRPIEYDDYSTFQSAGLQENIPPIIHFIWFANLYDAHLDVSKIPEKGSAAPDHCRSHNANFTVNVWNATDARALIETHYEWFLTTYDGYKHPIQRVDAFKYFVLFHYGGIYMDLDVDCRRPLDPLLPYAAWFPKTALLGVNNDVMAARAQHPLIREMTNRLRIRDRNLLFPYLTIYWSTGPQFTSDMVRDWVSSHRFRAGKPSAEEARSDLDGFMILPDIFYSEEYSFFGHSPGGTWHGNDVAVVLWLIDRPWVIVLVGATSIGCCTAIAIRQRLAKTRRRWSKSSEV